MSKTKDNKSGHNLEKRRFPRLESKHLISFDYFDEEQIEDIEGMGLSQNLSIGGILIEIDKIVRPGAILAIEIALKNHIIRATGKIVHFKKIDDNKNDVGINFLQIAPDDMDLLTEYFKAKGIEVNKYF